MKITCPNDPTHGSFKVSVEVCEQWIVDSAGDFQSVHAGAEDSVPIRDDNYECMTCRASATTTYE